MKASTIIRKRKKAIAGGLALPLLMGFTSCAVFKCRYESWNQKVVRGPDGVIQAAQARSWGSGDHALLLVHGFGDGPHVWKKLGPELAERGYRVRAMRLPGWNEPIEVKRDIKLADWEHAIIDEAQRLKQEHDKVAVLAHSLGGCISTKLVQSGDLPADALVLYAPMFGVSSERSPLLDTRTWYRIGDLVLPDDMILESLFPDHARVTEPRPRTERDPFVPVGMYHLLYTEMDRRDAQVPIIRIPVRLVLPGEDRVVDSPKARAWFHNLTAPTKTLYTDDPSGHVLPLDIDKLAEADRLVIWLTEQGITP